MSFGGQVVGCVSALWRYPVKSMQGEPVSESEVVEAGFVGDRALALLDVETGRVASAKSPRTWPNLLDFHAAFLERPMPGRALPPVRITLPDGSTTDTDDPGCERILSEATGRDVRLVTSNPSGALLEQYVPPVEGADPADSDVYRDIPNDLFRSGTLHDAAAVHLLTTATLQRLGELYPEGRFDIRRFRPNIVVQTPDDKAGFVENHWLKRSVAIGALEIRVTAPMLRCVMTTRAQGDLPMDLGILRTAAQHNRLDVLSLGKYPCVGVAGRVRSGGTVRTGAEVRLTD